MKKITLKRNMSSEERATTFDVAARMMYAATATLAASIQDGENERIKNYGVKVEQLYSKLIEEIDAVAPIEEDEKILRQELRAISDGENLIESKIGLTTSKEVTDEMVEDLLNLIFLSYAVISFFTFMSNKNQVKTPYMKLVVKSKRLEDYADALLKHFFESVNLERTFDSIARPSITIMEYGADIANCVSNS